MSTADLASYLTSYPVSSPTFYVAEWTYFTGAFATLLFIIDPFASVPMYLALTERFNLADKEQISRKSSLIALGMLLGVACGGTRFFALFGITMPAFQIAGGILLLMTGISSLNSKRTKVSPDEEIESESRDDISVFPLATPLMAGPGSISAVILLATKAESGLRLAELLLAICCAMLCVFLVLRSAKYMLRLLGSTGLNLMTRVMSIVLTAIAVQFILNGLKEVMSLLRS